MNKAEKIKEKITSMGVTIDSQVVTDRVDRWDTHTGCLRQDSVEKILALFDDMVEVAVDQKLPELSEQSGLTEEDKIAYAHYSAGYSNGQQRMLRAHDNGDGTETVWMKVIRKKEVPRD